MFYTNKPKKTTVTWDSIQNVPSTVTQISNSNTVDATTVNGVKLFVQTTTPDNPVQNELWVNPTTQAIQVYSNNAWIPASASASTRIQKTKFGVTATSSAPVTVSFNITSQPLMSAVPSVLKLSSGTGSVTTICNFDNTDATSFVDTTGLTFNGTMSLNPTVVTTTAMTADGVIGDGYLFECPLDVSSLNELINIEVV